MCRYDNQIGQTFLECNYSQHVLAIAVGIRICFSTDKPWALFTLRDSLELVYQVANKRVMSSIGQCHEDDYAARGVTGYRHNDD